MTKSNFEQVREFHRAFGLPIETEPQLVDTDTHELRKTLIHEEYEEVMEAMDDLDLENMAKEFVDLLYVVYGAALCYGLDLDKCFEEVHRSNMSKLGVDGKPIYRQDGKVLKGPSYFKADMKKALYDN